MAACRSISARVCGGASLVLSSAGEPVVDHLARLAEHGVTHLSGTPSHWRGALMTPTIRAIAPRYVRLSGEIADQAILDSLRAAFPQAAIGHAYASTEAGVAFDVNDGLAGFPVDYIGAARDGVAMKIVDGSLRIRSPGAASGYVNSGQPPLADAAGFVDTGQRLALILGSAPASKRILFTDSHGKERIEPQKIMIIEILVPCRHAQQTLGDQFAHGVFDQERITRIVKAAGQGPRDAQALIDLTQEQHPPIAAEIACRKVGDYLARTEVIKTKEQGLRAERGLGRSI